MVCLLKLGWILWLYAVQTQILTQNCSTYSLITVDIVSKTFISTMTQASDCMFGALYRTESRILNMSNFERQCLVSMLRNGSRMAYALLWECIFFLSLLKNIHPFNFVCPQIQSTRGKFSHRMIFISFLLVTLAVFNIY